MSTVYRVETSDGVGLYKTAIASSWDMQEIDRHPVPHEDAELCEFWRRCDQGEYIFGYGSIEQLASWIYKKEWRENIAAAGLVLSVYETNDYHVGATQAVFRKSTAKLIGRMDILNLKQEIVTL